MSLITILMIRSPIERNHFLSLTTLSSFSNLLDSTQESVTVLFKILLTLYVKRTKMNDSKPPNNVTVRLDRTDYLN